ncbi:hypothetical protein GQ457_17G006980 [Hibiscus cannabinus]
MQTLVDVDFEDASGHEGSQRPEGLTPSFKDKLIGMNNSQNGGSAIKELDVEVKEEDVCFGDGSELPEIWFSDRPHDAIDAKLAKSMIVRLLGRPIGYRELWNCIHALWNPVGEISLIDLDNEYYLVWFAIEDDFHKLYSEEDHPSHIMVWVRLPKLHYRYYTKSLFKYIVVTIGDVVRVDYNTEEGKRGRFAHLAIIVDLEKSLISGIIIDGKRQYIEYEGFPSIYFKCGKYGHMKESCGVPVVAVNTDDNSAAQRNPQELYGPWMQVVNRKRRNVSIANNSGFRSRGSKPTNIEGSRFEILSQEPENVFERADGSLNAGVLDREVEGAIMGSREGRAKDGKEAPKDNRFNVAGSSKGSTVDSVKPAVGGSDSVGAINVELPTVAARGKVVAVDSMLLAGRHSTVRVVNDDGGRATKSGIASNNKTRKGDAGVDHNTVADHLAPLVRELDKAAATENLRVQNPLDTSAMDTRDVDWCSNSVFEQLGDMGMQFKLLIKKQRPDIVAIMEPRISGRATDNFIKRSSFEFSYRVEAHGFSGGIWVLWRNTVKIEVVAVSNQFVHALCSLHNDGIQFFVSFVYASPNSVERRGLWNQLLAIDPGSSKSWLVGGDLNVICNSSERAGGSLRRSGVCPRFTEFLFDSALVDMGFIGPKFTWRRGAIFQRLDHCLCNMAWCNSFPESAIRHLLRLGSDHRPIMLESVCNTIMEGIRPFRYIVAWNDHPDFPNLLKSVWSSHRDFSTNISSFQEASRKWSIDVFGHIGKRKSQLLARLSGIDRALKSSLRPSLVRLEDKLKRELDEVLAYEESLWHQRSQITWISKGDRNTSFYHMMMRTHREHNTPPRSDGGEDQPFWRWESNGQFSARSAYGYLSSDTKSGFDRVWRQVWKLKVPYRVRMFAWFALHERLLTNVERVRRHMTTSEHCEISGSSREDIDHVLRQCNAAKESVRGAGEDIIVRGNILVAEARRAFCVTVDPCVNADDAVSTVDGSAGIGVVFQDNEGRWLFGFARFVGRCTVLLAELWAIHDGLAQAWMCGHRCVKLESDNLEAVRIVNSTSNLMHKQGLVLAIKRWLRLEWRVRVQHVPRGQNRVADKLAAKGRRLDYMTAFFATVPDDVVDLVTEERERSITERVRSGDLLAFPYDPGGDS